MKTIEKKTAVITGAASGIGRATALAFAEAGCHVAVVDINSEALAETVQWIEKSHPAVTVQSYEVDVSDGEAVEELAALVVDDFGGVAIIVNNAGINVTATFEEHTLEDFQRTFDVNLWGVIHGCRAFLPRLRDAGEGHIVNISSAFGIVGVASQAAYTASKFAVRGLSESLHEELADTDIGVSVVHPGCIRTNIVNSANIYDTEKADDIRDYFANNGCAPDVVGKRIVRAVRKDEHRVLITPETHLIDWMRRIIPTSGNRLINRIMDRSLGPSFRK